MIGAFISVGIIIACLSGCGWYHHKKNKELSFRESMDLLGLPVITFKCGSRKLNFLLDTGSNVSHIIPDVVKGVKCEDLDDGYFNISGIGGDAQVNKRCCLELTHNSKNYPVAVLVSEHLVSVFAEMKKSSGCNIHGLLGNDFFDHYKYVLDFKTLTAYSK